MAGSRALRAWLYACGWPPVKEELAVDGKKLYEIIFAQKNPEKERAVYSDFQLEAGPVLLKTGHRYLKRHVGAIAARYERICQSLGNSRAPGIAAKRLAARAILEEAEGCLLCL
jgi:tRNA A22 N-methylase